MRPRASSFLSVTLAVAAAVGPPAAAAPVRAEAPSRRPTAPRRQRRRYLRGAEIQARRRRQARQEGAHRAAAKQRSSARRRAARTTSATPSRSPALRRRQSATFGASAGPPPPGQDAGLGGTHVVAPHARNVEAVTSGQRGGNYVVLDSAASTDYVFMTCAPADEPVVGGRTFARRAIGRSAAGRSYRPPHLHFEIWAGAWSTRRAPDRPAAAAEELGRASIERSAELALQAVGLVVDPARSSQRARANTRTRLRGCRTRGDLVEQLTGEALGVGAERQRCPGALDGLGELDAIASMESRRVAADHSSRRPCRTRRSLPFDSRAVVRPPRRLTLWIPSVEPSCGSALADLVDGLANAAGP